MLRPYSTARWGPPALHVLCSHVRRPWRPHLRETGGWRQRWGRGGAEVTDSIRGQGRAWPHEGGHLHTGSETGGCRGTERAGTTMPWSWIRGEAWRPGEKTKGRAWGRRGGDAAPRGDGEYCTLGVSGHMRTRAREKLAGIAERSPDRGRANWLEERTLEGSAPEEPWVVQMRPREDLDHGVREWGCWFRASRSRTLLDRLEAVHHVSRERVLWPVRGPDCCAHRSHWHVQGMATGRATAQTWQRQPWKSVEAKARDGESHGWAWGCLPPRAEGLPPGCGGRPLQRSLLFHL